MVWRNRREPALSSAGDVGFHADKNHRVSGGDVFDVAAQRDGNGILECWCAMRVLLGGAGEQFSYHGGVIFWNARDGAALLERERGC